jgi:hypothetical protein
MNAREWLGLLVVICIIAVGDIGIRVARAQRGPEPKPPFAVAIGADYSDRVARVLAGQVAGDAAAHGTTVRTGDHTLGIRAVVDKLVNHDGNVIVGLDVQCKVDGVPADALYSGSLGIERTPEAAAQVAVEEWIGQYGLPIISGLRKTSDRGFSSGRYLVFPGLFGIRGEAPTAIKADDSIADLHRRFFQKLDTALPRLISSGAATLHAVNLTLVLRKGGPIEGECRVDGQVSDELCRIAKAFDWPAPTTTYMLKQYYVLRPSSDAPKSRAGTAK